MRTPDENVNTLFTASLTTLLLLVDKESITPGPFTYHHFWFRDAAYMIYALDSCGFAEHTRPIIQAFPRKQHKSGYFRSQQGEWDSNGQAMWTTLQHARLSNDKALLEELFPSLLNAMRWIDGKRQSSSITAGKPFHGLMPRGLSAEHLGHADYYFWDNFWSLAGLKSFAEICRQLDRKRELEATDSLLRSYHKDTEAAISYVQASRATTAIPAGPTRKIDCGMIGSVCSWYPLQLFPSNDPRLAVTLALLEKQFSVNGMFFQDFIHSGMNVYLTLQIAHAWLYAGERERFWSLFSTVSSFATPTMNFPEAIHPATRGGCMGDGHHGWAAAEVVLALREAFVYERTASDDMGSELILLSGIPVEWFSQRSSFGIDSVPITGGIISVQVRSSVSVVEIAIVLEQRTTALPKFLLMQVPVISRCIVSETGEVLHHESVGRESHIRLRPATVQLRVML